MIEIKYTANTAEITGYASVWMGAPDQVKDLVQKGAFKASIARRLPEMHREHKGKVGQWTSAVEDDIGLLVSGTVTDPETVRDLRAGRIDGLSIGFIELKAVRRPDGVRVLQQVDLPEISLVKRPAKSAARILQIKGVQMADENQTASDGPDVGERVAKVETAVADLGTRMTVIEESIGAVGKAVKGLPDRLAKVEAKAARPGATVETKSAGIEAEQQALGAFARTGSDRELKSMASGSDPDGGFLVLPQMSAGMTTKLHDAVPMRRLARVETIGQGDSWVEPVDFDDIGAAWVGEREARPETDSAELDMLTVPVRELYASQKVTQRLLDDASINLGAWIDGKINDKFIRTEGAAFISATTTPKRPRGLLSYPVASTADATRAFGTLQFVTSGSTSAVTADKLKATVWTLRQPYRAGATWLMNSNTANAIDGLKTGAGDYLWRNGMTAGAPNTLLGYPVEFDENMPDIAENAYAIAFGNFKLGYVIVDRHGVRFIRDNVTDKPNNLIYAYRRVGAGLANSEAIKLVKIAA